jgi:hypothetical protein
VHTSVFICSSEQDPLNIINLIDEPSGLGIRTVHELKFPSACAMRIARLRLGASQVLPPCQNRNHHVYDRFPPPITAPTRLQGLCISKSKISRLPHIHSDCDDGMWLTMRTWGRRIATCLKPCPRIEKEAAFGLFTASISYTSVQQVLRYHIGASLV